MYYEGGYDLNGVDELSYYVVMDIEKSTRQENIDIKKEKPNKTYHKTAKAE